MSRQIIELENVLQAMIEEHRQLLKHCETQQAAMRLLKLDEMQDALNRQEASRVRIANMEIRRKGLIQLVAKPMKLPPDATLAQVAAAFPQSSAKLLQLRDELKNLVKQVAERSHIAGKVAAAVLGHLNVAVRLFAGAVGQTGVYTKYGVPKVKARIGVMEAVG